jgi:hypothetical protein
MRVFFEAGVRQGTEISESGGFRLLLDVVEVDGTIPRVLTSPLRPGGPVAGPADWFRVLAAVENVLEPVMALEAAAYAASKEVVGRLGEAVEKDKSAFLVQDVQVFNAPGRASSRPECSDVLTAFSRAARHRCSPLVIRVPLLPCNFMRLMLEFGRSDHGLSLSILVSVSVRSGLEPSVRQNFVDGPTVAGQGELGVCVSRLLRDEWHGDVADHRDV